VAVINNSGKINEAGALQALTAAALLLPGLLPAPAHAVEDAEFTVQYGRYQEGDRQVYSVETETNLYAPKKVYVPQHFRPIEADSLTGTIKSLLTDRLRFNASFSQDTWAGATPVATGPAIFGFNATNGTGPDALHNYENGVVSGASPYLQTSSTDIVAFDKQLNPLGYAIDINTLTGKTYIDRQLAHTMAQASPETRRQGDFSLGYDFDDASVNLGGGISYEQDYESRFFNFGGRFDFNRKLTSLGYGLSYTNSTTNALVDHHANGFIYVAPEGADSYDMDIKTVQQYGTRLITGRRQDWGFNLNLTQVLTKNAWVELNGNYTHATGYMSNPYKAVMTFSKDANLQQNVDIFFGADSGIYAYAVNSYFERRPQERNQFNWNTRFVQYIEPLDAALHVGYRFFHDNWGIQAHTFDADWVQSLGSGWSVTPRIRYYSQEQADFYTPYLVLTNGKLPGYFSSDHRLSGYGALSGGVSVKKEFVKGISLEAGFDYYSHQGSLKLGGGGEGAYADFDYYTVNGVLNVNMAAAGRGLFGDGGHSQHAMHGAPLPSGVMFGHTLAKDQFMVGYRYQYSREAGDLLRETRPVGDAEVVAQGCGNNPCYVAPAEMNMHMHMLDLMYAPTDWLTLMLMPQFMDMHMNMRDLAGASGSGGDQYVENARTHAKHEHITGEIGDTGIYALFKLFENHGQHVHATAGFTAPTGKSDTQLRSAHGYDLGYIHYGMQIGSGTWDFKPSLTYTGQWERLSWGAQFSATVRTGQNNSGYTLGDQLQGTAWGGYRMMDWLHATLRGIYTDIGSIRGGYPKGSHVPIGPMDYTGSYGGRYWDVGFGVNASVPGGDFVGNTFSVEWRQPVMDDVNGYQLERDGALSANWSYMF